MPRVRPFRAVRYAQATRLSRLLCPPYDIIPKKTAQRLRREPFNAIHLELPSGQNPKSYRRARNLWDSWLALGVLRRDPSPFLYMCEQAFGKKRRLGLFVDLSLSRKASRIVPHERTFSKPKADRLELLKAMGANTSPIFGIVDDRGGRLLAALRKIARGRPIGEGKDPAGGRVRLWAVPAPGTLARALAPRSLLIADGHHRFQVSADYAASLGKDIGCLAYICSEADPGLLLLPTHRVVTPASPLFQRIRAACELRPVYSRSAMERGLKGDLLGLFLNRRRWLATPLPTLSPMGEGFLAVECLARVLDPERAEVAYTHDAAEAEAIATKKKGLAVLLPAPTVKDVRAAVAKRGLLPQKSTYFFPKVPTGLVFRELNQNTLYPNPPLNE